MILAARNLRPFLGTLSYPAPLLAERGTEVVAHLTRPQLEALIKRDGVFGVGSKTRIKALRSNLPSGAAAEADDPYRGDGPQYHYREDLGNTVHLVVLKRYCPKDGRFYRWDQSLTFQDVRAGRMRAEA